MIFKLKSLKTFKKRLIFFGQHIVSHENSNTVRLGEIQRLKKFGTPRLVQRIKVFKKAGLVGLIFFYLGSVLGSRNKRYKSWGKEVVILDHNSKIIENSIIQKENVMLAFYGEHRIRIPLFFYLSPSFIYLCILLFNRTKPNSIFEYNALMSFYVNALFARFLFKKCEIKSVLMVDDFSPKRIAFAMAANEASGKIGIVRMSDEVNRAKPFFPYDCLFCWSSYQVDEVNDDGITVAQFKLDRKELKLDELKNLVDLHIGIGLNAITEEHNLRNILELLQIIGHSGIIRLRSHPNLNVTQWKVLAEYPNVVVAPKIESLKVFSKQVDIVFTGTSSIIPQILLMGVPVIFSKLLDRDSYDPKNTSYKFVEDGIVFPLEGENINLEEVKSFYSNPLWRANQEAKTKISPTAIDVNVAVEQLLKG